MLHRPIQSRAPISPRALRAYAAAGLPAMLGLRAATAAAPTEILLYDEIGWFGVTAKDFVLALARAGDGPLNVRINSPGGDTFEGMAIYNALKGRAAPVTVTIDGIAASAASLVAMAGSTIAMCEASMLMIHNCWGMCVGNRNDMAEMIGVMTKLDGQMAAIYAARSGHSAADMGGLMDAETWLTSAEAKASGFCTTIIDGSPAPAANAKALRLRAARRPGLRSQLPDYDPDGDGDNDAEEAVGFLNSIAALAEEAIEALTGADDDDETGEPIDPSMPMMRAAATDPEWTVGADENLPIDTATAWDGAAAAKRMLDDAGFDGASPDPAKAKRGFLVWDHHNPKLRGSYKLPFADLVDGKLTALKSGLDAAASRLPQTDAPPDVRARARAVIDAYENRIGNDKAARVRLAAMCRRLRLAEADA